jgi:ACS family hexuronate transporter-like MFS transporter
MKIRNFRWWIAGLLLLASVLNYVDRNTVAVLAPSIQQDLGLGDQQYAHVMSFFMIAYTLAYLCSGWVVDVLGPRLALSMFVGWWSISNSLTGLASGLTSLGAFRFMLGLGEAGGYTASPKVVAEWFPARDRGVAVGLYSVGGALGAVIAPVLVIFLAGHLGWRGVFLVTPLFGLTFVALWWWLYRPPEEHPWLTDEERRLILTERKPAEETAVALDWRARWGGILRRPAVWALMFARLLTDPVWYFLNFWLPKYLHTERHLGQSALARIWVVYLAADVGFLAAGFISGYLVRRGAESMAARRRVLLGAACAMPLAPLVALTPGVTASFAFAAVIALAHTAWLASISTYIVDLVPKPILGTAFGFIAAGSAAGGILMNEAVGWVVTHHSYRPCFYAMTLLHPAAFVLISLFARKPWAEPVAVR